MDVTGANPSYTILDIQAPMGILRDTIPLPGDVVVAMGASITEIQSNFPPSILLGPPASLTFEVDEGRGFSLAQDAQLTNDGVFGSLLGATMASSASYVTVTPAILGNLAANEAGTFSVAVDSTSLLATSSPYAESLTVQDSNASNSPQTYNLTINVRPKATIDVAPTALAFMATRPITGPFGPVPSQAFILTNTGPAGSVLEYQIQRLTELSNNWLVGFSPVTGTLGSGLSDTITVQVVPVEGLPAGTYTEVLRVSGYSTNQTFDVGVQLIIT